MSKQFRTEWGIRWANYRVKLGWENVEKIFKDIMDDHKDVDWSNESQNSLLGVIKSILNEKGRKDSKSKSSYNEKEVVGSSGVEDICFDSNREIIHPSIDISKKYGLLYGLMLPINSENGKISVGSVGSGCAYMWGGKEKKLFSLDDLEDIQLKHTLPLGYPLHVSLKCVYFYFSGDSLVSTLPTLPTLLAKKFKVDLREKAKLHELLEFVYRQYIDFKDETDYLLFPLWAIGTYLFPIFDSYPYISLYGFESSGKSKTIKLTSLIAFNGQRSVGISPSALFRGTDLLRWALFTDEAGLFKKYREKISQRMGELMPLILEGYKKGAPVPRVGSKERGYPIEFFDVYCPKMFADTTEMDWVLGSRTIQIIMRPTRRGNVIGSREMKESDMLWQEIRDCLYIFALENYEEIKEIYDNLENATKLKDREWELYKPLLSIAKFFGDDVFENLLKFAEEKSLEVEKEKSRDRTEYLLIKAISNIGKYEEYIDGNDIRKALENIVGLHDWINNTWISRTIKKFNITCEKRRVAKGIEYKFKLDDISDMISRFGLESMFEEENAEVKLCYKCRCEENLIETEDFMTKEKLWICGKCLKAEDK